MDLLPDVIGISTREQEEKLSAIDAQMRNILYFFISVRF